MTPSSALTLGLDVHENEDHTSSLPFEKRMFIKYNFKHVQKQREQDNESRILLAKLLATLSPTTFSLPTGSYKYFIQKYFKVYLSNARTLFKKHLNRSF